MKIEISNIKKMYLTDLQGLDPVSVYMENYKIGQGKLIVECYGESWSHYWGAMGDSDLEDFIISANTDYVVGKLFRGCQHIIDYDKISEDIGIDCDETDLILWESEIRGFYGPDWKFCLPKKVNHNYEYLYRIIETVKEALSNQDL